MHRQNLNSFNYAIRWKTWLKTLMKGVASIEKFWLGACSR